MNVQQIEFNPQDPDSWPPMLSLKEFRAIARIGHNKALSMAAAGDIPVKRVRGRWMMTKVALLDWLRM